MLLCYNNASSVCDSLIQTERNPLFVWKADSFETSVQRVSSDVQ